MISPCKRECELNTNLEFCIACKRSKDEIKFWTKFSDEQREQVMADLDNRDVE